MTLCILDINVFKKTRNAYLIISAVVLVCDIVSEFYSHGIYSLFSRAAFLIPLAGGAAVYTFILKAYRNGLRPGLWAYRIYNTGIGCLTAGFTVHGVLDVYGTGDSLVWVLFYAGPALLIAAAVMCFVTREHKKKNSDQ